MAPRISASSAISLGLAASVAIAIGCGSPKSGAGLFEDGAGAVGDQAQGGTGAEPGAAGKASIAGAGTATVAAGATSGADGGEQPSGGGGSGTLPAAAGTDAGGSSNGNGGTPSVGGNGGVSGGPPTGSAGAAPDDGCSSVAAIVSKATFEQIFPTKSRNALYSYEGFVEASASYPDFGTAGDCDARKRDIAAFFANVAHQTAELHYVEQINKAVDCASTVANAPCADGKKYYGRGPMQLTWNYNYFAAGDCLGLGSSLLTDPDKVANDAKISWLTGLWFWNTGGANHCQKAADACAEHPDTSSCNSPHNAMTKGDGFGATIDLVNGAQECVASADADTRAAVVQRACYYRKYVQILGTSEGPGKLTCGSTVVDKCP